MLFVNNLILDMEPLSFCTDTRVGTMIRWSKIYIYCAEIIYFSLDAKYLSIYIYVLIFLEAKQPLQITLFHPYRRTCCFKMTNKPKFLMYNWSLSPTKITSTFIVNDISVHTCTYKNLNRYGVSQKRRPFHKNPKYYQST